MLSNVTTPNNPKKYQFEFTVVHDNTNMRLDRFLRTQLKLLDKPVPQQVICKWIRKGKITVTNGDSSFRLAKKEIQPTTRVQAGQKWVVTYVEQAYELGSTIKETDDARYVTRPSQSNACLPLDQWVVYEDDSIVVINKPAGVAVQGGTKVDLSIDGSLEATWFSKTTADPQN
ncbi:hypothetical protein BGZ73_004802 [Actinomortierella ambigua]|nr:hypothetical protein BGZ73_004802 [Actinomortierella ambigua]